MSAETMGEAKAYKRCADSARSQIHFVKKSGWNFFDKRCAIYNLEGLAELFDTWAEVLESSPREGGSK